PAVAGWRDESLRAATIARSARHDHAASCTTEHTAAAARNHARDAGHFEPVLCRCTAATAAAEAACAGGPPAPIVRPDARPASPSSIRNEAAGWPAPIVRPDVRPDARPDAWRYWPGAWAWPCGRLRLWIHGGWRLVSNGRRLDRKGHRRQCVDTKLAVIRPVVQQCRRRSANGEHACTRRWRRGAILARIG